MKVMTVLGTRPEIIRLSRVIPLLDRTCEHVLVYTGQNYEHSLSSLFFEELGIRQADYGMESRSERVMQQIAVILTETERLIETVSPDALLILGDTNSGLSSIVAKRMGVPVFHMEAGNRCYDDRIPEEVNRRLIDHASDWLLPYTNGSRGNLLREGIPDERICVSGNPIREVLDHYAPAIDASEVLEAQKVEERRYFLVTLHRAENVDVPERLAAFVQAFHRLAEIHDVPVICSVHPRTRSQLDRQGLIMGHGQVRAVEPLGLFDFVRLERSALCILTDSGTVQEECCLFRVPSVILRDVTERPETLTAGSGVLSGADPDRVVSSAAEVIERGGDWVPPVEYLADDVSQRIAGILLGDRASFGTSYQAAGR